MRELVFYWLRLYRNNQSLLRRRFPDFSNEPARKKKFHYLPRLSIINSKKDSQANPLFKGMNQVQGLASDSYR